MTPEQLVQQLQRIPALGLKSVILYGSAAAGDHAGKRSDFNVLVVTEKLGTPELLAMAPAAQAWTRAGNSPPLLFTEHQLRSSADVFPIEVLDMKDSHRALFGRNVVADIKVDPENLRLQLEHELKGRVIRLREQFLLTAKSPRKLEKLIVDSLSTFLVLFRGALRLFRESVPAKKMDALRELANHIPCDPAVFEQVRAIKEGRERVRGTAVPELFERYLNAVEAVTNAVDAHLHK